MAKMLLDKAGIEYLSVDAASNLELTKEFDVKKAPTLIVPTKDGDYDKLENVSFIKQYIESRN